MLVCFFFLFRTLCTQFFSSLVIGANRPLGIGPAINDAERPACFMSSIYISRYRLI